MLCCVSQVPDGPCTTYLGAIGAGNYVKMVHNGIEYGDMQLIAEAYDVLKTCGGERLCKIVVFMHVVEGRHLPLCRPEQRRAGIRVRRVEHHRARELPHRGKLLHKHLSHLLVSRTHAEM